MKYILLLLILSGAWLHASGDSSKQTITFTATHGGGYMLDYQGEKTSLSECNAIVDDICEDPEEFLDSILASENRHSFSCLRECTRIECPFTRFCSDIRQDIEQKIMQDMLDSIPDTNKRIILTSFGSGNFFQDLVVLSRLLKAGYTNIHVNCIDKKWRDSGVLSHLKTKKLLGKKKKLSFDKIENMLVPQEQKSDLSFLFAQTMQLLRFVPETVTMSLYGSSFDYLADCKKDADLLSTIICGIDYDDPKDSDSSILDYRELVDKGLSPIGRAYSATQDSEGIGVFVEDSSSLVSKSL